MNNNAIRRILIIGYIFALIFLFCGCWDYKEIEKRGYVLGIAIDKAEEANARNSVFEKMLLDAKGPIYSYTAQIPVISRSQNKPYGQSGGDPEKPRHWNLTVVSNSYFEANREYSTRTDYVPYHSHLQVIVLSKEVACCDISKLFDMFLRDPEMRRRTKLFITPGKAVDVLKVVPEIDDYSSQYLRWLTNNSTKTSRMLHRIDLGEVSKAMHENRDFALPKVVANKREIKNAGCAVFKHNKFVGWLDEIKTGYLKIVQDNAHGGVISLNLPEDGDSHIVLEIRKIKTKQRPIVKDDSVKMRINVKANLSVAELNMGNLQSLMDSAFVDQLERLAEEKIKKEIEETIEYVQDKYGADVFMFGVNINRFAPATWDRIKDDWDEEFKDMKVDVSVKVKINQIGLMK